jgi:hypothetical protein
VHHEVQPVPPWYDDLKQLIYTLDALRVIGKPARSALPNLAAFILRAEMPSCLTMGARQYVRVVRAIATAADVDMAVTCVAPLLRCAGPAAPVVDLLTEFGPPARPALLSLLRDDARTIAERWGASLALAAGQMPLEDADKELVALLQAKCTAWMDLSSVSHDSVRAKVEGEVNRCRAEAGLPTELTLDNKEYSWDFPACLSRYLCGPTIATFLRTASRCLFGTPVNATSPSAASSSATPHVPPRK